MNTIEAFRCVRLDTKLTRTSCGARYTRAAKEHAGKTARGAMKLVAAGCVGCDIGKAHRLGENPAAWPDGTPLEFVQLRVPTPPLREEPSEPTPALPPSREAREAPREAEADDREQDVQQTKRELDRRLNEALTAPSEEGSEPDADPQTSPETPAAPRKARGKTYAFGGRDLTISQWMDEPEVAALGISPEGLRLRIKKGWPIEEALTTPKGSTARSYGPEPTLYPFRGEQRSVAEVAALPEVQALGLTSRTIYARLRGGCTLEEAATTPKRGAPARVREPVTEGVPTVRGLGEDLDRSLEPAERVERLLDLQVEVRAQLRALAGPGTPHDLADVYAAAAAELAAYQAIRGGRA